MAQPAITFSHMGIHCFDVEPMYDFYTDILALTETDRGLVGPNLDLDIRFLSSDPDEHHQVVLVSGRDAAKGVTFLNQISFRVASLSDLRDLRARLAVRGVKPGRIINHGMSWSMYFPDPEGNNIEAFVDSPWQIEQPVLDLLDLSKSDAEILEETEKLVAGNPTLRTKAEYRQELARKMGIEA
ncbi:MAG: VOC family protein [Chloroflexi bacterium]|nr:VOC family protein [Chloroflexota bacterium]